MKVKILTIILLSFGVFGFSQDVHDLWQEDYDKAVQLSKKNNKPILVFYTGSDWCGPCIMLEEDFFESERFLTAVQDKYVLYEANFPRNSDLISGKQKNDNLKIQRKYKLSSFPTVLILNKKGKVIGERSGYNLMRDTSYYFNLIEL